MKKIILAIVAVLAVLSISGCKSAADTADENLSKAAENFEVPRRIVGINAITDNVLFSVEGYCSYETSGNTIDVICATDRTGKGAKVMRTTLGKSDNVTFVVTQLQAVDVDFFHPRVIFRPERPSSRTSTSPPAPTSSASGVLGRTMSEHPSGSAHPRDQEVHHLFRHRRVLRPACRAAS